MKNQYVYHSGKILPLSRDNVDTDQIIPKQFLKSIKKFITEFEGKYRIKIVDAEEDFTSQAVANKKENEDFDSKSAELIFEGWFNQNYG